MRDKAYRKQQEVKKSYKKFVTEMKQEKFKEPSKKRNNNITAGTSIHHFISGIINSFLESTIKTY